MAFFDRVLVMDQGKIVEEGAPGKLLDAGGCFAEIFNRQGQAERA